MAWGVIIGAKFRKCTPYKNKPNRMAWFRAYFDGCVWRMKPRPYFTLLQKRHSGLILLA